MSESVKREVIAIISVVLITIIGKMIHMERQGLFYAAISAVILTSVDFKDLLKKSKERLIGTIIGGIIGVILSYLDINDIYVIIIGEILVIFICEKILKIPSAIASIVFLVIIYGVPSSEPYIYGLKRVLDTTFGILMTVFVTYTGEKLKFFWKYVLLC